MRTKITLLSPRPNQIRAIGNSAIDGNGLNIEVRISRKSAPIRVALAKAVNSPARTRPARYPFKSSVNVNDTALNSWPDARDDIRARTVSQNVGNSNGFASHRAYPSHAAARMMRSKVFRTTPRSNMHAAFKLSVE